MVGKSQPILMMLSLNVLCVEASDETLVRLASDESSTTGVVTGPTR
jgi:hypothetical protein